MAHGNRSTTTVTLVVSGHTTQSAPQGHPATAVPAGPPTGSLPYTGAPFDALATAALAIIATGTGLIYAVRRKGSAA